MFFLRLSVCFCALLFVVGCRNSGTATPSSPAGANAAVSFPRDVLGRSVALKSVSRRAVILGPGALESAFALGAKAQIVGRDSASDFPVEAKKLPVAGDYRGPFLEATLALRPDLVIIQGESQSKAQLDDWQTKLGVPVAAVGATTVADVGEEIESLGAWLGRQDRAATLKKSLQMASAKPVYRPRVFIEVGRSPLWTAGKDTLVGDVVTRAGFQNIAAVRGYQAYGLESLGAQKFDFYLVPTKKSREQTLAELRKTPALASLPPIRAGKVLVVDPDLILRPGPRLVDGLKKLRAFARTPANPNA